MSVTNAKHVRVVALLEVGVEDEAVLVLFVRVSGHVAFQDKLVKIKVVLNPLS